MNNTAPVIFGSSSMYERLCLVTEVLGAFVSVAPRTVGIEQLARQTGRPAKELARLCNALCREQLLASDRGNVWRLAGDASEVTLEDAFRFVVNEQAARSRTRQRADAEELAQETATRRDVDLLVMQAAISINQSVFQHLRQFSLDRLKIAAAGMFPSYQVDHRAIGWRSTQLSFS